MYSNGYTQDKPKTQVQLAHENKWDTVSFIPSQNGGYQARVFYVKPPKEGEEHHWFLQILDKDQAPANFAEISLNAYRKGRKADKLKYMAPVFPLCADGKYIIGFIEPNQNGIWKLEMEINHFGTEDFLSLEMEMQ